MKENLGRVPLPRLRRREPTPTLNGEYREGSHGARARQRLKITNEEEIAARLRSLPGDQPRFVVSGNFATPWELVRLVNDSVEHCRVFTLNPQVGWPVRAGLVTETPFVGPGVREDPLLDYLPMRLSLVPRLFESIRCPDAVLIHTSAPRHGKVSLGIEVNVIPSAVDEVRRRGGLVVAQVNERIPYTYGDGEIAVEDIDLAIEVAGVLPSPAPRPYDDASAIGQQVARLASDGCTIQTGIGQLPEARLASMRDQRGVGVWGCGRSSSMAASWTLNVPVPWTSIA